MTNIIAFQTDPLLTLKPGSDTSLFLAATATERGYRCFFYEPQDLLLKEGTCVSTGTFAHVTYSDHACQAQLQEQTTLHLNEVTALFIRQDPPFNMDYVTNTYLLELLTIPVFNNPTGLRATSEKMAIFKFPQFIPSSMVVGSWTPEIEAFLDANTQVIMKPLYYFGGKFVEVLSATDRETAKARILAALHTHHHILLQKFLPAVYTQGDKRVFILDGQVSYAMNRRPAPDQYLANLAAGGSAHPTALTPREHHIAETVGRYLKTQGIILAGLDLINEHLVEINVTSPTGLIAIHKLYGVNLAEDVLNVAEGTCRPQKRMSDR